MIAFFDVDRTLLRGYSASHFLLAGIRGRSFPLSSLWYMPSLYLRLWLRRMEAGPAGWEFPILRGLTRERLEELARESFAALRRDMRPRAQALLAGLRAEGWQVVFATTSLDLIVAPLARRLGVTEVLASRLEFAEGRATGRFEGPPLFKEEKKRRVMEYLREHGERPEDCAFYSDSILDLPLLEAVGRPVAVNPDRRLARSARRRGWSILRL
jgi:HAD superfamily hydrolase (TIGR01490 family)